MIESENLGGGIRLEAGETSVLAGEIVTGLTRYNDAQAGPERYRALAVALRDGTGRAVGGLLGHTHWRAAYVGRLWVEEALRGRGMGRRLMLRAEEVAGLRGCRIVHLETLSFQSPGFYEKLGYEKFAEIGDYADGHTLVYMSKRIG